MIDAELEHVYSLDEVPACLARGGRGAGGLGPAQWASRWILVVRSPRIQAWREADELPGRSLVRGGAWTP